MDELERSARIRANLGIEPITHGQIHTFQIAIPDDQKKEILPERRQVLQESLLAQKTNLVPLIIRRTEAYSEDEKYEVVYGADWCIVAKELDIEKLWVWVFDLTDEQAAAAKIQMEQLVGSTVVEPRVISSISEHTEQKNILPAQLEESEQEKEVSLEEVNTNKEENAVPDHTEQIKSLLEQVDKSFQAVETLNRNIEQIAESVTSLKQVIIAQQEMISSALNIVPSPQKDDKKKKDYNKMTVAELRQEAKNRHIKLPSGAKKAQIIAAIEKNDSQAIT